MRALLCYAPHILTRHYARQQRRELQGIRRSAAQRRKRTAKLRADLQRQIDEKAAQKRAQEAEEAAKDAG